MTEQDTTAINPFAPPNAIVEDRSNVAPATLVQAPLARRAAAAVIDLGVLYGLSVWSAFQTARPGFGEDPTAAVAYLQIFGIVGLVCLVQGVVSLVMFYRTGQSIGKRLMGIRVVRADGSRMSFGRAIGLRWMVSGMVVAIPSTVWGLVMHPTPAMHVSAMGLAATWSGLVIDHLLALRADRRTLHDLIAGSRVATAASTPNATLDGSR